ncbi:MAG: hypothetical protein PHP51_02625 [Desulfotomaculaceae bacterium]|nr:hypothetical protein [Desulfotomaculaceae bacterium]MDD4767622.1 hypothetical protein [Desulfotomaculaceae bacterium]
MELRQVLQRIAEFEELQQTLLRSLSALQEELAKTGLTTLEINEFIELVKAETLSGCNKLLMDLNRLAITCEKLDLSRHRLLWRFLSIFKIDYDKVHRKRLGKRLLLAGVPEGYLHGCIMINDIGIKVGVFISIIQFRIIKIKLDQVDKDLQERDKAQVCRELERLQKQKIANDRELNYLYSLKKFKNYLPKYLPLVHPSPLNIGWLKQNPWFEVEVLPVLKKIVRNSLK